MIEILRNTALNIIKQCIRQSIKLPVCLAAVLCGSFISFLAGQHLDFSSGRFNNSGASGKSPTPLESVQLGMPTATPSFLFPPVASYSDTTPANAELTRPDQLNLACLYEESEDTSQPSDSMAGKLYKKLAIKDSQWISGIFDLYNYTPEQAASLLGLPAEAVTTPYGLIKEFKHIQVHFYNGDGQEVSGISNTRSIISMANILCYYGALDSMEALEAYTSKLWENSHSYQVHMGGIYYCDGSCRPRQENISREGVEKETGGAAADEGSSDAVSEPGPAEALTDASLSCDDINSSQPPALEGASQVQNAKSGSQPLALQEIDQAQASESSSQPLIATTGNEDSPDDKGCITVQDGIVSNEVTAASEDGTGISEVGCPGHVDLFIHIMIKGVSEKANLYMEDPFQPSHEESNRSFRGWDETTKGWVDTLNSQDWYKLYGLNTTELLMGNPLTSSEIDVYMKMLPADTSQERRAFVKYALSSVGKIPYYWGGKPVAPGYTGNNFGSVMPPDEDGRFLKGLDCSGWINWVYWSVTGRGLGAESTGTLINSGTAIARSDLLPGDVCIRTGSVGHVVIFLGWTADGKMLCVQETTGKSNNVEVGIVTADWQSYRRIVD